MLLESGDPEATATQEYQTAQSTNPPPTTKAPYITQGARAQVAVFQTSKGWKFAPLQGDGAPNIRSSKFMDTDFQTFVGYFSEDGESQGGGQEEEGQQGVESEGIGAGGMVMSADLTEETKRTTSSNFIHISGRVQSIWDELPEAIQERFKSIRVFANHFTGARPESFERKLINSKVSLHLDKGVWNTIPEPPQEAQTSLISESFKDLVDSVADGKCDPEVLNDFAMAGERDVLISPKGSQEDRTDALVFNDKTGFLRMLLDRASATCGTKIRKEVLRSTSTKTQGGDNAIRGFAFEDILEAASLLRLKAKHKGMELSKDFTSLLNLKLMTVNDKLSKLNLDKEVWVKAYEESGMDPNQVAMIKDIAQILEGGLSNNLYASMLKHSNQSLKTRGAIYALPVGDQVGAGQRQDVLEIYGSMEDALDAAKRSGVDAKPTCDSVENAFTGSSEATLGALKGAGVFREGQQVCALKVSLKNYMKLDHAVFGGGRFTTFKSLLSAPRGESNFKESIIANLGMDDADYENFEAYSGEMDAIGGSVYGIPLDAKIKNKDGTISQRTSKNMAEELVASLNKKHNYPELNSGELKALKNLASTVIKDEGTRSETEVAFTKLQHRLNGFLQAKKLQKDLKAGGVKAKQAQMFAAFKMFHAGGSDDNDLICDYRELTTGMNYVFKQNDPLRDAWSSVMSKDGNWNMKVNDSGQVELTSGSKKIITKNELVTNKNSKRKVTGYNVNYVTQVDRATMEAYDTSGGTLNNSTELGKLLSRIHELFEKARVLTLK